MTPDQIWSDYCSATGHSGTYRGVDAFGDGAALQNELLALVLDGTKQATCSLARDFNEERPPEPGDHWIITDGHNVPKAIIRTRSVEPRPIREVDETFARIEGEGDKSLKYWKQSHDAYFRHQGDREGFVYDDSMIGLCEQFDVVWPINGD